MARFNSTFRRPLSSSSGAAPAPGCRAPRPPPWPIRAPPARLPKADTRRLVPILRPRASGGRVSPPRRLRSRRPPPGTRPRSRGVHGGPRVGASVGDVPDQFVLERELFVALHSRGAPAPDQFAKLEILEGRHHGELVPAEALDRPSPERVSNDGSIEQQASFLSRKRIEARGDGRSDRHRQLVRRVRGPLGHRCRQFLDEEGVTPSRLLDALGSRRRFGDTAKRTKGELVSVIGAERLERHGLCGAESRHPSSAARPEVPLSQALGTSQEPHGRELPPIRSGRAG